MASSDAPFCHKGNDGVGNFEQGLLETACRTACSAFTKRWVGDATSDAVSCHLGHETALYQPGHIEVGREKFKLSSWRCVFYHSVHNAVLFMCQLVPQPGGHQ